MEVFASQVIVNSENSSVSEFKTDTYQVIQRMSQ